MILALAPATVVGWAHCEPGGEVTFGATRMGALGSELGASAADFEDWLTEKVQLIDPVWIVYESVYLPNYPNPGMIRKLVTFAGIIEMVAYRFRRPCREFVTSQVAKHFTGQGRWPGGRAGKKAACRRTCERYGFTVTTDDEADAIAVLMLAESVLYPSAAAKRQAGPLFQRG